ncbi:hypothetical protein ACROYT_G015359 [Oculina patagonica]
MEEWIWDENESIGEDLHEVQTVTALPRPVISWNRGTGNRQECCTMPRQFSAVYFACGANEHASCEGMHDAKCRTNEVPQHWMDALYAICKFNVCAI